MPPSRSRSVRSSSNAAASTASAEQARVRVQPELGERRAHLARPGLLRRAAVSSRRAVGCLADPLVDAEAGLGDDRVGTERLAEDGLGEVEHRRRVALVAEGGGGRDRGDAAERAVGLVLSGTRHAVGLERQPEPAQQHGDVGALGAVVGVELVEHEVLQRLRAVCPDLRVRLAQQQLVEHLVVGQQDVRGAAADDVAVGDQPVRR